ncbi:MAG TPA: DUF1015 domain-containing protein [Candidatus Binataceae bacterium]|nr:DUF1015 domain-containing protein [Candidatus Binataceae bacterium]
MTARRNAMTGERIEPFRALMYDRAIAGDLAGVVAPPYDLIGAVRQNKLYARSRYNIVRLEFGREADRYAAAESTLREWLAAGVLRRLERLAIFHYTQRFTIDGRNLSRTGLIARIRLEPFGPGRILPHEKTFPAAKQDRLKLLTAIRTNTSSLFGLYSGQHPELDRLRATVAERAPLIDLIDDLGIRNELRVIDAPTEVAEIQRALATPRVLIADGHHRYETALNYQRTRRAADNPATARGYDYTMMTMVACDDPGLVILPTHRVVHRLRPDAMAGFAAEARKTFTVEEISRPEVLRARLLAAGRGAIAAALRGHRAGYLLRLSDHAALSSALPGAPADVRALDVSVLHTMIFDRICSLTAAEIRKGGNIEYTIDAAAALEAVASGAADGAFLMNPPSIEDVERVSDAGATMPEKSTYFHPKLLTGLVMNPLDD